MYRMYVFNSLFILFQASDSDTSPSYDAEEDTLLGEGTCSILLTRSTNQIRNYKYKIFINFLSNQSDWFLTKIKIRNEQNILQGRWKFGKSESA